jgi:hypothetical protein
LRRNLTYCPTAAGRLPGTRRFQRAVERLTERRLHSGSGCIEGFAFHDTDDKSIL